jgi:hypothetical protein
MSQAAAAIALLRAGSLADLAGYQPVDALIERVIDAANGVEGLDVRDHAVLRRWSSRWARVDPSVRAFYARALKSSLELSERFPVDAGIRSLLDATEAPPSVRGRLERLHVDLFACASGRDLTRLSR